MKNVSKRSAASRKAWRTRKRMKQMRELDENETWLEREMRETDMGTIELEPRKPAYMDRALPNPWLQ